MLVVEVFSVSCFEGACGYLAVSIGLLGFFIGALGGLVCGLLLGRRRPARAA
jgi:ABC-type nitrate/sulfonate/bicarbonate transport system permease component